VNTGIDRKQAEAFAKAVRDSQKEALADFAKMAQEASARAMMEVDSKTEKALITLEAKFDKRFSETEAKIDRLEHRLDMRMDRIRYDIIFWLGGLFIFFVAVLGLILIKLLR